MLLFGLTLFGPSPLFFRLEFFFGLFIVFLSYGLWVYYDWSEALWYVLLINPAQIQMYVQCLILRLHVVVFELLNGLGDIMLFFHPQTATALSFPREVLSLRTYVLAIFPQGCSDIIYNKKI